MTTSAFGLAKKNSLSGLLMPATVDRKYPATPSETTTPVPDNLTGAQASPHWLLQAG